MIQSFSHVLSDTNPLQLDEEFALEIHMQADSTNTDVIYVGGDTFQLFPLAAGERISLAGQNSLSDVWIRTDTIGQKMDFLIRR